MTQREIKFRGWYQETEKPTSFDKMYYSDRDYKTLADFFKEYQIASIPTETHKAVLMQYTGLKDKNGQEIYEGDIVDISPARGLRKAKVQAQIIGFTPEEGYCFVYDTGEAMRKFNRSDKEYWRVIGNVWEHPELIKNV